MLGGDVRGTESGGGVGEDVRSTARPAIALSAANDVLSKRILF